MKINVLLPALLISTVSLSQKSPMDVEVELKKQFQKIYYWNEHPEINDSIKTYDSMAIANVYILNQIVMQGYGNPSFLNYSFRSLKEYLDIVTSRNKSFRIYSWDTYTGGTMHIFYGVAQFIGNDKNVHTQVLGDTSVGDPGLSYLTIYTFNNKGFVYYLCIGDGRYSTHELGQDIRIFNITSDQIKPANIIRTKSGLTNLIHLNYDFFQLNKQTETVRIDFDNKKQEIIIPIVLPNGKMTSKYIIYKFNGHYFIKI